MSWASRLSSAASGPAGPTPAAVTATSSIPSQLPTAQPAASSAPSGGAYVPPHKRVTFADTAAASPTPEPPRQPRACEGVTLAPMRLADLQKAAAPGGAAGAAAPRANVYVPPSRRAEEEAKKPATLNIDDARAFPTFAAPGRPAPKAAEEIKTTTLNFKKTIEDLIVKEEEDAAAAAAAAAAPKEEDPLKMSPEQLREEGFSSLRLKRPAAEILRSFYESLARAPEASESPDDLCPDGPSLIYEELLQPYKSPIIQGPDEIVKEERTAKCRGLTTRALLARRAAARAANGPGEAARWAASGGASERIGSTDAEASAAALSRHILTAH
jgi:hypothetical protein